MDIKNDCQSDSVEKLAQHELASQRDQEVDLGQFRANLKKQVPQLPKVLGARLDSSDLVQDTLLDCCEEVRTNQSRSASASTRARRPYAAGWSTVG